LLPKEDTNLIAAQRTLAQRRAEDSRSYDGRTSQQRQNALADRRAEALGRAVESMDDGKEGDSHRSNEGRRVGVKFEDDGELRPLNAQDTMRLSKEMF